MGLGDFFKKLTSNPVLEEFTKRAGLSKKPCPVPMFSIDGPADWWEGALEGRTVGLLEAGRLWVGGVDEEAIFVFRREGSGFVGSDLTENENSPILKDAALLESLGSLSASVAAVGVYGDAVDAAFDWKKTKADALLADLGLLVRIKSRAETFDPPLVRAVMRGDFAEAKRLLDGKPDLEAMTLGCLNAVTAAAQAGRADILKELLAAGAKAMPEFGFPLHRAARKGHIECVRVLLDAGVPVNMPDPPNDTALHEAAKGGHRELAAFLLSRGADKTLKNTDGATPVDYGLKV
jgi:hypothetical protein